MPFAIHLEIFDLLFKLQAKLFIHGITYVEICINCSLDVCVAPFVFVCFLLLLLFMGPQWMHVISVSHVIALTCSLK